VEPPAVIILLEAEPDLVLFSLAADPLDFKDLGGIPGVS
jgi:hypothetical protein